MSSAAYVESARNMARFLEDREAHVVGDRDMARNRIEQRYGIASSVLYSLRYRPPKRIAADIYARLCSAVEDAGTRQIRALEHEIAKARASGSELRHRGADEAEIVLEKIKNDTMLK